MVSERLVGRRVVLRYRHHKPGDQPPLTDVVGTLTELTLETAVIDSRTGRQIIERAAVVAAKAVQASRRDILELERISRLGWRAAARTELDGWLLYADQGWTGRANSALPLSTPNRPLDDMLADVLAHYDRRGLVPQIQVPLPARELLDAELGRRGWTIARPTVVLTRSVPANASVIEESPFFATRFSVTPDDDWIAGYHYRGGALPDFAQQLLTRHEHVTFATIERDGRTAAIGRGVIDEGWLGITAIDVEPAFRRQGLATAMMAALFGWGAAEGARDCYLQVDQTNDAASRLYAKLGFNEHHRYHYRVRPEPGRSADGRA